MTRPSFRRASLVAFAAAASVALVSCDASSPERGKRAGLPELRDYVAPQPVRTFPASEERINGWLLAAQVDSMRAHSWDLWESITASTSYGVPVWETWYSGYELFVDTTDLDNRAGFRDFGRAHQLVGPHGPGAIPSDPSEEVFAFNRYTRATARYIWDNGLNLKATLDAANAKFDSAGTPIAERQLLASADSTDEQSVVLKVVWQFIGGDEPTLVPYYAGDDPSATTDMLNPSPSTWRQGVWVDPTGSISEGTQLDGTLGSGEVGPWPVVGLDRFYWVRIDSAQAAAFSDFAATSGDDVGRGNLTDSTSVREMVQPGNIALMMAIHATTKEIPNWTWNTYWWNPDPDSFWFFDRPESIPAPWNQYATEVVYSMTRPDPGPTGDTLRVWNPYLESNLHGYWAPPGQAADSLEWFGVQTNCMTCHRLAAWPISSGIGNPGYRPAMYVSVGDTVFAGYTKLDFLYSLQRAR